MDSVGPLGSTDVAELGSRVARNVARAVKVPDPILRELLIALLAGGHVLIEDYPGVGKTALARALAASIDAEYSRMQCTSDMLPADMVGTNVFNQREGRFEFRPGPVFANLVLVDEINRASAKTQSGLLECMQERRVTVDGATHELAQPFVVLATQNPIEFEGTYPLPAGPARPLHGADRARLPIRRRRVGDARRARRRRPRARARRRSRASPRSWPPRRSLARVHASEPLRRYIVAVLERHARDPRAELGASPRAGLMLLRAAMVRAALEGRDHVLPDDMQELAQPVLAHRILLAPGALESDRRKVVAEALGKRPGAMNRAAPGGGARRRRGVARRRVRLSPP